MNPKIQPPVLDSELEVFSQLETKIDRLLQRYEEVKKERDTAVRQKVELETLLRRREAQIAQLQDNLAEAKSRSISPEKEQLIKQKLQELADRLKNY